MSTWSKMLTNSHLYTSKRECPDKRNSGDNAHFDSGWMMNLVTPNSLCEAPQGSDSKFSVLEAVPSSRHVRLFSPQ